MNNMLNCFNNFSCIKGDCKKSCCALWKVNIDKKTLKKYKRVKGDFKEKINSGVDFKCASFNMINGRCAFLNNDNLCDLIINLGEKSLCEVCAIHPRFINKLKSYTEMGVGIACEEGARLLLSFKDKITPALSPNVKKLKGFEKEIIVFRQTVLQIIYGNATLSEKVKKILSLLEVDENAFISLPYMGKISKMEVLDSDWKERLKFFNKITLEIENENELLNLLVYFIYRHLITAVDKLDLKAKTLFSIFSTLTIHNIYNNSKKVQKDISLLSNIARDYSAEIEYSEDNLFSLFDLFEEFILKSEIKNS